MNIGSPTFLAFLLGALLAFHGLPRLPSRWRMAAINAVFVASFFQTPLAFVPVASFAVIGWLLLHVMVRARSEAALPLAILGLLGWFVVLKRYSLLPDALLLDFPYAAVGLSYLLFRVLHLLIDVRQEALERVPDPVDYLNYLFCFLTFVAGPIQRYEDHRDRVARSTEQLGPGQIQAALARMLDGFVKVVATAVVASDIAANLPLAIGPDKDFGLSIFHGMGGPIAWVFSNSNGDTLVRLSARLLLHGAAFLAYLYVNFSGYMDIVLGAARLFGFSLPENFDRPMRSRSLLEFWTRWHITLSDWFKTYLFQPLLMALAQHVGRGKASAYLAVPAFMVTFMVMGVWHGTTEEFRWYGLILGLGVAANKLFQLLLQGRLGKKGYARLAAHPLYAALARGVTLAFFTLMLCCLWLDARQMEALIRLYGGSGLARLMLVASLAAAFALWSWDAAVRALARWPEPLASAAEYLGLLWLALVWGNLLGITSAIERLVGFGLHDAMKAGLGGLLLLAAWSLRDWAAERPKPGTAVLSVKLLLLVLAALSHAGAVPDFVYKGF
ncbi:hypothetical protein A6A04_03430 [Paramagnetospirillum marisnigri]|uniref:Acyltransferase n=1 Tax=Paramagnetospirillum marisnigri TaxID=1285242 RepID=A0A178MKQ4_9PROT|nr:MBOAT family O-acyltransferase [Paramagnetospirillum marisnigri]OAN49179.1 hypothetical protein A6A04_03430 [Paramagnetospirillum marisnigri]